MNVFGVNLLGARSLVGKGPVFRGFDPVRQCDLEPGFGSATADNLEQACALAEKAFPSFRSTTIEQRARLLETIAFNLEKTPEIVQRAMTETGLPHARLTGELARTVNQLRLFARVLRDGRYLDVRIDPPLTERTPVRPDLRLSHVPIGPVAVFGASNFPLAFSVAGGDTVSALAAGCPVIVKAHPAHPGTSELVGRVIQAVIADCDLPDGTFSLLFDAGTSVGAALVADPRIQAVGFTGSRRGGLALVQIAQKRPQPIPVYAEMSSINPVVLLAGALAKHGAAIGSSFAQSLTLGAGQFCTNPGLVIAVEGRGLDAFVAEASEVLGATPAAPMLTRGIYEAYASGVASRHRNARLQVLAQGPQGGELCSRSVLFATTARDFLDDPELQTELFGAASLLVRCPNVATVGKVIAVLEGQLTMSVHAAGEDDLLVAAQLMPLLERKAGRILLNGFGTGVEVCDAMIHGGPFPSTSDSRTTSVGSLAIMRFLRPVCYQDVPDALLPAELKTANPWGVPRRVAGQRER